MNWREFFRIMVLDERAALAKYEVALEQAQEPELRAVLERLRDEEAFHIDYLQENWARLAPILGECEEGGSA
jgi:rubrerythrin